MAKPHSHLSDRKAFTSQSGARRARTADPLLAKQAHRSPLGINPPPPLRILEGVWDRANSSLTDWDQKLAL